jgi:hypothetical protein
MNWVAIRVLASVAGNRFSSGAGFSFKSFLEQAVTHSKVMDTVNNNCCFIILMGLKRW